LRNCATHTPERHYPPDRLEYDICFPEGIITNPSEATHGLRDTNRGGSLNIEFLEETVWRRFTASILSDGHAFAKLLAVQDAFANGPSVSGNARAFSRSR
jgi:hypothetical protein